MGKYKYFLKNIGLFFLASFIPKLMSFLMVPLYTSVLSTSDYGTADLLTNTVALLMPILSLQVQDAVMKYSIEKKYRYSDILGVSTGITLAGAGVLVGMCLILNILHIFHFNPVFYVFLCINFLTGSLYNIFSYFCRGIDKIKQITIGSIIHSAVTIGCNLFFLLGLGWGLYGYLIANSLGTIVCVVYLIFAAKLHQYFTFSRISAEIWKEMILFSIPMIFSALSWWINNAADKYILTFFCGASVVGIYAVASKIPTILSTLGSVIAKAFSISAIKNYDQNDRDGFFGNSYSAISLCMVLACSMIMILNIGISHVLFAKDFFLAWKYVPLLLISVLMNQLSQACESFFLAAGQTKVISGTAIIGALLNTVLNFLFIPTLGAYGAALATALSFFATWGVRYGALQTIIHLHNHIGKEVISYLLLFVQAILAYWGNTCIAGQIVLLVLILLLYRKKLILICQKMRSKIG